MSDLKNVLKAGLLVTASLFATGCGDDTASSSNKPNPNKPNNPDPNKPVDESRSSIPSDVKSHILELGSVKKALYGNNFTSVEIDKKVTRDPVKGYGPDFDLFSNLVATVLPTESTVQLAGNAPTTSQSSKQSNIDVRTLVGLFSFEVKEKEGESFRLNFGDTRRFPLKPNKETRIGGMIFDGMVDKTRSTIPVTIVPAKDLPVKVSFLIARSAVVKAGTGAAVIELPYAYFGVDAAAGYEYARVTDDGKEKKIPVSVHSTPTDSVKAQLSGGNTPPAKKTSAATASKSTTVKTVDVSANKAKAVATVVRHSPANAGGGLTLKFVRAPADTKKALDAAGLDVGDKQGTLDIGGRVAKVEGDVVIYAISADKPELEPISGIPTSTVEKTKKPSLSAGNTPKKKSQADAKSVAAASAATANKDAIGQGLVRQADGNYHFMYQVKSGGYYAEIGQLSVGPNTTYVAASEHPLYVHNLDLQDNLKIRVLAEEHTFDKLSSEKDLAKFVVTGDKVASGQSMMKNLVKEGHSIHESEISEGTSKASYMHYDSHTSFPLWVSAAKVTPNKTLTLEGIDLDTGVTLTEGVHAMPLVKDMSRILPNSSGQTAIAIGGDANLQVERFGIISNGFFDMVLVIKVGKRVPLALSSGALDRALMSSKAQGGRSVATATLDAVVAKLDPTNMVSTSFASLSSARLNQASQIASLTRGVNGASAEKLGAVEQYSVTFNHAGTQFGLTYNLDGGNAFSSSQGTTSFGANLASDVAGIKAIVSAEASVDAGKNAYASSTLASYNAGVTFAKAYSLGGLSVVPMTGFGVSSNALNSYSAVVPMAVGMLGLSMNDVSFTAATFHAGVNLALDDFVATATGANASLTLGVAGYLASSANATLSTSEGKTSDLSFGGDAVTPYAQFNLGFATGEKLNTMISSGIVAVSFGLDR